MNTDEQIIARVRAALTEVDATRTVAVAPAPTSGWGRQRLLAVAATVVLVGGAVTAVVVNLSNRDGVSPAAGGDTTAVTMVPSPELTMPYFLAAADLAPGPVLATTSEPVNGEYTLVWARHGDLADAALMLHAYELDQLEAPDVGENETVRTVEGAGLLFASYGLTAAEREALAVQVVPGSGLPWILPVEDWELMELYAPTDGMEQTFGGTATLAVGALTQFLFVLEPTAPVGITNATVAGEPAWTLTSTEGGAVVVWRDPTTSGRWVSLRIPASMADRVDGLIAAIVPATPADGEATASTVPTPGPWVGEVSIETAVSSYALPTLETTDADPAIGQPMPPIRLTDGTTLTVDTPTLFVFVADWCPHCNEEVPQLSAAVADGSFGGVRVVLVATGSPSTRDTWTAWLAEKGWTGDVIFDTNSGERAPGQMAGYFGAPGYPYLVMVNSDGTVTGRTVGQQPIADTVALTQTAA